MFLTALKMKGETPEEITGFALKMRERALKINFNGTKNIIDAINFYKNKNVWLKSSRINRLT